MRNVNVADTIAAVATAMGESGIGIVRMSGKGAFSVADNIFLSKDGKKPSDFKTYTVHYGWIVNASLKTDIIDEVLLTVMRAPKSYTKEDIVEISCHGGIVGLRRVLELVLARGCRLAEPGEFTKRAFLNGRIDLAQAEAVVDIIKSKTESALKIGVEQLQGGLSGKINGIRKELLDILAAFEATIDFPEEEISQVNRKEFLNRLRELGNQVRHILDSSKSGKILREGIRVVICGKPNVGKSSLLNALLKQERSIVTPIAGTTRDTVEEVLDIKGIPVRIVDTAGIIEPRDLIEKKSVRRSKRYIELADLVLLLFDNNKKIDKADEVLMRKLKKKPTIVVINKMDLKARIQRSKIEKKFNRIVDVSAKKMRNIHLLEETIAGLIYAAGVKSPEPILVSNIRHIELIRKSQKLIAEAADSLDNNLSPEFIALDVKGALEYLDCVLGKSFSEDLLDKIFSEFCIGK
jgi:tRNA modification GTPase